MESKKVNYRFLTAYAFITVFTYGVIMNLRGVVNPLIQSDYSISYSQLGVVLSVYSIGSIISTLIGGFLIRKVGLKKEFRTGFIVLSIGLIMISFIDRYVFLLITMLIIGLGIGLLMVGANTLASRIFIKNKGRMMNIFHLFFGISGLLAPIYINQLFDLGFSWEQGYTLAILLVALLFLISLFSSFPQRSAQVKVKALPVKKLLKDKRVLGFMLTFALVVALELGIVNWVGIYLSDIQQRSSTEIGFYVSAFFSFFILGRLVASIIIERFNYFKFIVFTILATVVIAVVGVLGPDSFAICFSISGFFISMTFPTLQAVMFEIFESDLAALIGATLTAGELGNIFFSNWLVGLLNDLLGIRVGFLVLISYGLLAVGVIYYINYQEQRAIKEALDNKTA
ncbi:MFS transporter [Fuchsiella alkaliacetigena]|uniref:MFS transporter n=1 Tax=Fuchsiella alkaliacetigena TaxID=957042 RepID=UPI00200B7831|nr:MFS transporter [Fuchsiella alkaliacetigena]MCK8825065.1 MFS transporter [Fuchsiella alkaliacetigena]